MQNSIHSSTSQSANEISPYERKRAPDRASALNRVQPLDSNKKIKAQPSTLNASSLREARLYTSEPYATDLPSARSGDILMGRGGATSAHQGNIQLRALITHGSPTFAPVDLQTHAQLKKSEKKQVCLDLLQELHSSIPRRRFLEQSKHNNFYHEVPDERATLKIGQLFRDLRAKLPKNENTSAENSGTENNSARISQHASLENPQDYEPIDIHASYSYANDHLHELRTNPDLDIFLDCFSENNNDQKPAATPTLHQTLDELEPIPFSVASSEESGLEALCNNPSLNLFLDHFSENNNDQKPAAVPSETQVSQPIYRSKSWTIEEDKLLIAEKSKLDQTSVEESQHWSRLSTIIPEHTPKAIRDRWVNHLNPALNKAPFSHDEYDQIKTGIEKHGHQWVKISHDIFGSKRSENDIKNQFHTVKFKNHIVNKYGIQSYLQLTGNHS